MTKESKPLKTFARSEQRKIRENFIKRAREAPLVNPLDPSSMEACGNREYHEHLHA